MTCAVVEITTSGNGVDIVTAPAGAGKTYALAAAREAWERAGYRVIGAAHTGVAADELTSAAGIPSTTIARLLIAIARGEPGGLDQATVLVVDEAGTAGTRDLARLLGEVDRSGGKAVLVGDSKQLPEIAAGGLFAGLIARQPTVELRDNRRQREEWERDALRHLRDGDTDRALTAYREHDRITVGFDAEETKHLLVADWWAARVRGEDAVMLAGRRSEVAELNVHGRLRALHSGQLVGSTLEVDGLPFQRGEAVMMLRNNRSVGVHNGNRGVVLDVDPAERTMRVRLSRGDVNLPAAYLDAGHVGHAYAMTVNKAHGMTCERTMVLGNDQLYRELVYGAMSRGQLSNQLYLPRSCFLDVEDAPHIQTMRPPDPMEVLASNLEQRRAKHLALDEMATIPLTAWSTAELHEERRRLRSVLDQAPPDRAADLAALRDSQQTVEGQLLDAAKEVAQLESRRRPLRQRHKPNVELIAARTGVGHLEQQSERHAAEVVHIEASQHRRESHLAAHDADRLQVDAIDGVLRERIRQNIVRSVADPPNYIVRTIGPRPAGAAADRCWVSAVVAVEGYRVDHDVTDRRTALGPEPHRWEASLDWYAAHEAVVGAQVQLGISRPQRHTMRPEIEVPSLDLGL